MPTSETPESNGSLAAPQATKRQRLLPEHRRALDMFYEARRCGDGIQRKRLFSDAHELLKPLLQGNLDEATRANVAETAANFALEAGEYRVAARIAREALAKLNSNNPDLTAELVRAELRASLLDGLERRFMIDWLSLEHDDRHDLIVQYNYKRAEIVFDADLDSIEQNDSEKNCLQLAVPTKRRFADAAAKTISDWMFPWQRPVFEHNDAFVDRVAA